MANSLPQQKNTAVDQLTSTNKDLVECRFEWKTDVHRNTRSDLGTCIFAADNGEHSVKWRLGFSISRKRVYLTLFSADDNFVRFTWNVCLAGCKEDSHYKSDSNVLTALPGTTHMSDRDDVYRNSMVNIVVHIHIEKSTRQQTGMVTPKTVSRAVIEDLGRLFNDAEFSDVTIIVGDSKIPVHKNILALRSDVFAAMFRQELEEKKTNQIIINDFDTNVIMEMLRYIYTGDTSKVSEMPGELLTAACEYAVEGLKEKCISQLYSNLTNETAVQALISAHLYSFVEIKQKAIEYINAHFSHIIRTTVFQNLVRNYPNLMLDILAKQ